MTQYRFRASAASLYACLQLSAPGACAQVTAERVSGAFTVAMTSVGEPDRKAGAEIGQMLLDKQYFGDLTATGQGRMLSAVTGTRGSAAYVAIERVSGTLRGKTGSFVIQHAGTMSGGAQTLQISIVPDSGTGQLAAIRGAMAIRMVGRDHFYDLDYTLAHK